MLKTLVVDDDADKRQRLCAALEGVQGFDMAGVDTVTDVAAARRKLTETTYELLVLDIALPPRADKDVEPEAGLGLLDEITSPRSRLRVPAHIIGVTGFEHLFTEGVNRFSSRLLTLVHYDAASDEWEQRLQARLRQILAAQDSRAREPLQHQSTLAVLCALPMELAAIQRLPWNWKQHNAPGDHTIYWRGTYRRDDEERVVYAAECPRMGMPNAAVFAMKLIHAFRPRYLAMAGITAGIRKKTELGNVIVASPSWDGGSGKWTIQGDEPRFLAAPHQLSLDVTLREQFKALGKDVETLARIKAGWPGEAPSTELRVHVGPLVSNASVLADKVSAERLQGQHRELLGVEMEAYGVFAAAEESSAPSPTPLALKAVVDFADGKKNDRYQPYAAYTSAQVLRHFAEKYL
ncbi:hypothetical protein [Pyxidicoccus sp. MSG2]|uniref:phosphorylase family protein n=1 Tax=Pyxidicoccus sp. MSG2 TaxID=2996790 RepID=UPI00226EBD17|nr:hypothetical protein [Pyxidicoccus sp. MSG2]MCY1022708.1 hypothetical protein [Pyxidicoccus sp. MSG2]